MEKALAMCGNRLTKRGKLSKYLLYKGRIKNDVDDMDDLTELTRHFIQ